MSGELARWGYDSLDGVSDLGRRMAAAGECQMWERENEPGFDIDSIPCGKCEPCRAILAGKEDGNG